MSRKNYLKKETYIKSTNLVSVSEHKFITQKLVVPEHKYDHNNS